MDPEQMEVILERFSRATNLLRTDLRELRLTLQHAIELNQVRLATLEKQADDHELRLRAASEGVTQFKVWSGLTAGGSGLVSLIALIKTFWGGQP